MIAVFVLIINTFSFQFLLYYFELSSPYFQYIYLYGQNMSQIAQLFLPLPLNPTLDVKANEFFEYGIFWLNYVGQFCHSQKHITTYNLLRISF